MDKTFSGCFYREDERDYLFWDVDLGNKDLPDSVLLDNVDYQIQWLEKLTINWCVFYGNWHWSNELNHKEWSKVRIDNKELCQKALDRWYLNLEWWAYLNDWPKLLKELWYIEGYLRPTTIEHVKKALSLWFPVVVWSNKLDFSRTYIAPKDSYGHCVLIIGYNSHEFIIKESYWKDMYDEWKQYLKYEDFNLLFAWKYILVDKKDPILEYEKKIMEWINIPEARESFKNWFWNWKDPQGTASREEVATMIQRMYDKLKK